MNTKDSDILICSPTAFPLLYSREVGGFGCSQTFQESGSPGAGLKTSVLVHRGNYLVNSVHNFFFLACHVQGSVLL